MIAVGNNASGGAALDSSIENPEQVWFEEYLRPHLAKIRRYLILNYPSVTDPDDLVQESAVRTLKAARAREVEKPVAYMFQTARRLAVDAIRRERRSPFRDVTFARAASVTDEGPDAVAVIDAKRAIDLVNEAIALLPERQQLTLRLRRIEGLSYREIATKTGIPKDTVENLIYRAFKKMSDMLHRAEEGLPMLDPKWRAMRRPLY